MSNRDDETLIKRKHFGIIDTCTPEKSFPLILLVVC
jgi:hypothetical protein